MDLFPHSVTSSRSSWNYCMMSSDIARGQTVACYSGNRGKGQVAHSSREIVFRESDRICFWVTLREQTKVRSGSIGEGKFTAMYVSQTASVTTFLSLSRPNQDLVFNAFTVS